MIGRLRNALTLRRDQARTEALWRGQAASFPGEGPLNPEARIELDLALGQRKDPCSPSGARAFTREEQHLEGNRTFPTPSAGADRSVRACTVLGQR